MGGPGTLSRGWLIEVEAEEREGLSDSGPDSVEPRVERYRVAIPNRSDAIQEVARAVGVAGDSVRIRALAELSTRELEPLLASGVTISRV